MLKEVDGDKFFSDVRKNFSKKLVGHLN